MNHDDDFIAQLEDYLVSFDDTASLPDRVRDAIRAELPSARQVRPRPGFLRDFTMFSNAPAGVRFGLAAAAVAVVVLGAAAILDRGDQGVGGPGPSATAAPSLTPTLSPRAAAALPMLSSPTYVSCGTTDPGANCLPAGTYRLSGGSGEWPVVVAMDVPTGWFEWQGGVGWDAVLVGRADNGSGWGVMFYTVGDVARDPCDSSKGTIPAAQVETPQKLAAAMAAWPSFSTTNPEPITVDGRAGVKFTLTSTAPSSCAQTALAGHSASGTGIDVYPTVNADGTHDPSTVQIIDTGKGLLVMRATDFPQSSPAETSGGASLDPTVHAAQQPVLHEIIDSVRITDWPTS